MQAGGIKLSTLLNTLSQIHIIKYFSQINIFEFVKLDHTKIKLK